MILKEFVCQMGGLGTITHRFKEPVSVGNEIRIKGNDINYVTDSAGNTFTEVKDGEWHASVVAGGEITVTVDFKKVPAAATFEEWGEKE